MYSKILFPTDGSKGAEAALEHAVSLAEKYDAELHVLYVADVRVASTSDMMANLAGKFEEIGNNALDEIQDNIEDQGLEVDTELRKGIPHEEINNYVEENDIDLITMGTHGRTGIDRLLVGSTTEKVIRTAEIPVLTVRRNGD